MSLEVALVDLHTKLDTETHVSDWFTISQERINQFAEATLDQQWIHVDVERATAESPFGTPIAHGFLTLSLLPYLTGSVNASKPRYEGVRLSLNYGMNRVRFPNPVPAGSQIRVHVVLKSVEQVRGNGIQMVNQVTIEIKGVAKPACVADMVSRLYF